MRQTTSFAFKLGVCVAIGLVSMATVTYGAGLVFGSLSIWVVDVLLWGGMVTAVVLATLSHRQERSSKASRLDPSASERGSGRRGARAARGCLTLLPFGVLVPGIVAVLGSPRLQMSFHGFLHSAYTYEIMNGLVPPDNPLLPGHPANDYWLYHVLLGGLAHSLRIAPPLVSILLNMVALVVSAFLLAWILRRLGLWPTNALAKGLVVLVVLFALNLFGIIHTLGFEPPTDRVTFGEPSLTGLAYVGGARSAGLFGKFLNFNGFPLGIAFFLLALTCGVRLTRRVDAFSLAGFAAGLLGALVFHATTGAFGLGVLPVALAISTLAFRSPIERSISRRTLVTIGAPIVFALIILAHYVLSAANALNDATQLDVFNGRNFARFFVLTGPLIPFFVLGFRDAVRKGRRDLLMLSLAAVGGGILACVLVLAGGNQYKFDYLAALPMALVAVAGWWRVRESRRKWVSGTALGVAACSVSLVIGNQLYTGIAYLTSSYATDKTLAYDGPNVVASEPGGMTDAWEWLRANSPKDSIVLLPVTSRDRATLLPLSQRLPYMARGGLLTAGYPEFEERAARIRELYSSTTPSSRKALVLDEVRKDANGRPLFIVVAAGRMPLTDASALGLDQVFSSGGTQMYRVRTG